MKISNIATIALLFLISSIFTSPTASKPSSSVCLSQSSGLFTWNELPKRAGETGIVARDYDLPVPFKNGLVWATYGGDNWTVIVFAKNLCPSITKEQYSSINRDTAERYVMSGQALMFHYWGLNNDPNIRREDDRSCLRATCLTAKSLTQGQIAKILRSERSPNK